MGFWTFTAARVADIFIPGAGLIMDAVNALELIEVHITLFVFDKLSCNSAFAICSFFHACVRTVLC
jgi:hypothetical protein